MHKLGFRRFDSSNRFSNDVYPGWVCCLNNNRDFLVASQILSALKFRDESLFKSISCGQLHISGKSVKLTLTFSSGVDTSEIASNFTPQSSVGAGTSLSVDDSRPGFIVISGNISDLILTRKEGLLQDCAMMQIPLRTSASGCTVIDADRALPSVPDTAALFGPGSALSRFQSAVPRPAPEPKPTRLGDGSSYKQDGLFAFKFLGGKTTDWMGAKTGRVIRPSDEDSGDDERLP